MSPLASLLAALTVASSGVPAAATFPRQALFFGRGDGAFASYAVNADGTGLKRVAPGLVSPDGRWRALVRCRTGCDDPNGRVVDDLYVTDASGRRARRVAISPPGPGMGAIAWAPDSRRLAYALAFVNRVVVVDRRNGRQLAELSPADDPRWAPDGRRLLVQRGSRMWTVRSDGSGAHEVADSFQASWAPDGKRLAYVRDDGLYIVRADGKGTRLVTRAAAAPGGTDESRLGSTAAWSPRGDWIAVTAATPHFQDWGLYVVRPNGSGFHRVLDLGTYGHLSDPLWSPGGRWLATELVERRHSFSVRTSDVVVVDVDTGATRVVTQGSRYGYENAPVQWHPRRLATKRIPGAVVAWTLPSDTVVASGEIRTSRVVDRLAADGTRAAYTFTAPTYPQFTDRDVFRSSPLNCAETWDPVAATVLRLREPCSGKPWGPQGVAVAGPHLAWIEDTLGSIAGSTSVHVYGGTVTAPAPTPVFGEGDTPVGDLLGDGDLVVFDTWSLEGRRPCIGSQCYGGTKTSGALYRVEGDRAVRIATSPGALTPLAVDAGRILVDRGEGVLQVLDAVGSPLRTFQLNAALVRGAKLQGQGLVVLTPTAVEVTDANTGAFVRRWPAPADATLEDVQDGIAVLVAGADIHLLRLSDGRDAVIRVPGAAPVLAQLEPGGLFYSYRADDATYPGRVAFVASEHLP